ncbi:MAG TPA: hypothetical protein VHE60_00280 [Pyrinomonadaceae bacterium]|nr:hypothetical protein [Pyrinomonadaceae bacterium]
MAVVYLGIAARLTLPEHPSIVLTIKTYLNSGRAEWLIRWLYLVAGLLLAYLASKLFSLLRSYLMIRKAEKLEVRRKFRETQKGWLDYRLASEESSKHLHFLVARFSRKLRGVARAIKLLPWLLGREAEKPPVVRTQIAAQFITVICDRGSARMDTDLKDMEATANVFIESTEGYLKTAKIVTRRDYVQLAGLHEYFEAQLKDVRDIANSLSKLAPAVEQFKGVSQDCTAAINRQASIWRSQVDILRKVEGHCARMVKMTQAYFDRAILNASEELLSTLVDLIKLMGGDKGMEEYRRLPKKRGLKLPARFA